MPGKKESVHILLFIGLLGYITQYGLTVFLSRHLSPPLFGDLQVAIGVLNLLVSFALFGTDVSVPRFLSGCFHKNQPENATNYLAWNLRLVGITFLITLLLALISSGLMAALHAFHVRDINQYHLAIYMLWLAPFAAISSWIGSFLISSNKLYCAQTLLLLSMCLIQLVLFATLVLFFDVSFNRNMPLVGVLFISAIFSILLGLVFIGTDFSAFVKPALGKAWRARLLQTEWFEVSTKFLAGGSLNLFLWSAGLFISEIFSKNESAPGQYAVILTICEFLLFIPGNLCSPLIRQTAASLSNKEDRALLQSSIDGANKVIFFLTLPIALCIVFFSRQLLGHFGPDYPSVSVALIVLTSAVFLRCNIRPAIFLLEYGGDGKEPLRIGIIETVVLCILGPPAAYFWGVLGVEVAFSVALIVGVLLYVIQARRKFSLRSTLIF